jgi:hypothetical protein
LPTAPEDNMPLHIAERAEDKIVEKIPIILEKAQKPPKEKEYHVISEIRYIRIGSVLCIGTL